MRIPSAATLVVLAFSLGCVVPGDEARDGAAGEIHVALEGAGGTMAMIVLRNVFNPAEVRLVECEQKDHTLNGSTFCDELIVLPPGVYEVRVQSREKGCTTARDHYKVVVQPRQTVELEIELHCGGASGGLDVIVRSSHRPVVEHIDFNFSGSGERANKFVCLCGEAVTATFMVTDGDGTACEELIGSWTATGPGGVDAASQLLTGLSPCPDLTLFFGTTEVYNANDPQNVAISITAIEQPAAWVTWGGSACDVPDADVSVDWSLTWYASTQTGSISVVDYETQAPLLTGTVIALDYSLFPDGAGAWMLLAQASLALGPNAFGLPQAPVVVRFVGVSDWLTEDPGDPSHLSGPFLNADIFPLQTHGIPGDGVCLFPVTIDTGAPAADYKVGLTVTDPSGLSGKFNFPIHLIDCGLCPGE